RHLMTAKELRPYMIGGLIGVLLGLGAGAFVRTWHEKFNPFGPGQQKSVTVLPALLTNEPGSFTVSSTRISEPGTAPRYVTELRSHFVIKEGSPQVNSGRSMGTGGACYLADLGFARYPRKNGEYIASCLKPEDCNPPSAMPPGTD